MGNTFGITFHFRSRYYKLVDIQWGSDNSFYFLPYRHEAEIGTRLKTEIDDTGIMILDINEVLTGQFPTRKISRHPSGYFHLKDVIGSGGNREKDGLVGPAFKDAGGFYVFLVACPQAIETLVKIERPEPTDIVVNLPGTIEPFTVQFAVWDKSITVKIPSPPGKYLGNGAIAVGVDSFQYGMVIMLVNVQKTTPETDIQFPARTCYIVR